MCEFVKRKLEEWGLEKYIQIFIEKEISEESFMVLDENDLKILMPKLGPRKIFLKRFQELRERQMSSEDPLSGIEDTRRSTPECQVFQFTSPKEYLSTAEAKLSAINKFKASPMHRHESNNGDSIRGYLTETVEGISILKKYDDKQVWSNSDRTKLATLIINKELRPPNFKISSQRLAELTALILEEFPREMAETYYEPFQVNRATAKKVLPRGKLYNQYTRLRSKLIRQNVVTRTSQRQSAQETSYPSQHFRDNFVDTGFPE